MIELIVKWCMEKNNELFHACMKKNFIVAVDIALVMVLLPMPLYLRAEIHNFKHFISILFYNYYILLVFSYLFVFWLLKPHCVIVKLANIFISIGLILAAIINSILFYILSNISFQLPKISRSGFFIQTLLFFPARGFVRFYFRIIDCLWYKFFKEGIPALVYRIGANTSHLLPSLLSGHSAPKLFGILDDSEKLEETTSDYSRIVGTISIEKIRTKLKYTLGLSY